MRAIIYCARMETDGLITRAALKRIGAGLPKLSERVNALVEVGRWTINEGGGYLIHDYLKYNPSKASREKQREQGRERVAKHRLSTDCNAVTPAYHSKGTGRESLEPEKRVKLVSFCKGCGKLNFECCCDAAETA